MEQGKRLKLIVINLLHGNKIMRRFITTKVALFILSLFFILNFHLFPQEEPVRIKGEEVAVVATRTGVSISQLGRSVLIITAEEVKRYPVHSIPELFRYCLGIDIQERGPYGTQADLSIRGSTFQQILVLIDGVRINDLQTAHHNMDIPIPLESIERIEILYGGGSALYGPDAFGGVINIVTKYPEKTSLSGRLGFYEYKTTSGWLGLNLKEKGLNNHLSIETNTSEGFMTDRDFNLFNISERFTMDFLSGRISFLSGYQKKDFGAYDFYTPGRNLPSRESTRTTFLNIGYERIKEKSSFSFHLFYRHHYDNFILDKKRPWFYNNETTNSFTGVDFTIRKRDLAAGGELVKEGIESIQLGNHSNIRGALFLEFNRFILKNFLLNIGLREDFHRAYGSTFSPSANISIWVNQNLKIRASSGHSFRAPSYTELYYQDPVNSGNKNLRPEKAWSFEIGIDADLNKNINTRLSIFHRDEKELIDWIKGDDNRWYAENIKRLKVRGAEVEVKGDLGLIGFNLRSSFMDAKQNQPDLIYKYGFRFPENQTNLSIQLNPSPSFSSSIQFVYKKRIAEKGYVLIDGKITKKFGRINIFMEGTNLLNTHYEDIKGVPMPGRWLGAGFNFDF
ncbi:MAG: TonB-dependent receptor [Clostridiales bacterium]|nr:TonB-dependent receptor [Clostridiales bacterium]